MNDNKCGYSREDWQEHYDADDLRWDLGEVSPIIRAIGESIFPDGLVFDFSQMSHETLTPESDYSGIRLKFKCRIWMTTTPIGLFILLQIKTLKP